MLCACNAHVFYTWLHVLYLFCCRNKSGVWGLQLEAERERERERERKEGGTRDERGGERKEVKEEKVEVEKEKNDLQKILKGKVRKREEQQGNPTIEYTHCSIMLIK